MLFDDKLSDIIRTIENDGLLLHPTESTWNLSCSLRSKTAINKIYKITKRDKSQSLTLLVDSLKMLKKHVPHIHPRIETLLHYHQKPLIVVYPNVINIPNHFIRNNGDRVAIHLIHDSYCNQIIRLLGNPLVTATANIIGSELPTLFEEISKEIKIEVDITSKHRRTEAFESIDSVMIDYNHDGEINFLNS